MANITINLDGNAEEGLQALESELGQTGEQVQQLTTSTAKLNEVQRSQLTLIQKQTSDWKTFTVQIATAAIPALAGVGRTAIETTVPALGAVAQTAIHAGVEMHRMAHASTEFALKAGLKVVNTLSDMAMTTLKYTLFTKGAVDIIHAVKGTTREATAAQEEHGKSLLGTAAKATALGVVLTTVTGQWRTVGEAAAATGGVAAKALGGLIPIAAGATVAWAGFEMVLARTGTRIDEFGEKSTNLDRVSDAAGRLTSEVGGNLAQGLAQLPGYYAGLLGIGRAWREVDAAATRSSDTFVENVGHVRDLAHWLGLAAASTEGFDKRVRRTADDFERLREISKDWAEDDATDARTKAAKNYAEALGDIGHRITQNGDLERDVSTASLEQAMARIDAEIRKRQEAAGEAARNNKFTKEEAEKFEADMTALRNVRAERERELDQLLKDLPLIRRREQIAQEREHTQQIQDEHRKREEAAEESSARIRAIHAAETDARRQFLHTMRQAALDDIEFNAQQALEAQKAGLEESNLSEQQKADAKRRIEAETLQSVHDLKMKRIAEERNQELGMLRLQRDDAVQAAKDTKERIAAEEKWKLDQIRVNAKAARDLFAEQQQFERAQIDLTNRHKWAADAEDLKRAKEKQAKLKALQQDALEKAGVKGEDLLQLGKKQDVSRILQDQARQKAAQKFQAENSDAWRKAQFDSNDRRQFQRQMERAQEQAALQARKDFAGGKTDPQALAQAQAQAAQKQLGALAQTNKLSADSVQAMGQLIQATAEQQATTMALQRQVDAFTKQAQQLNGQAQQSRRQAQAGSLR